MPALTEQLTTKITSEMRQGEAYQKMPFDLKPGFEKASISLANAIWESAMTGKTNTVAMHQSLNKMFPEASERAVKSAAVEGSRGLSPDSTMADLAGAYEKMISSVAKSQQIQR